MAFQFGRTQSIPPKEASSRSELLRQKLKVEGQLKTANRLLRLVEDQAYGEYRDYMIREILRPAEDACRTLSPYTHPEDLLRNQVTVQVVRRLLEEPQLRGNTGTIQTLQKLLESLKARLSLATR